MSMDVGQLTQMTTWLDEEHRRSKAELIRVQQQLENQAGELQDHTHTIQDLETRVASMQAQVANLAQFQSALQQLKEEIVHMLAQAQERRQQEDRETERVRAIERDNVSRTLNEIRRDLQRLSHLEEEMNLRKAEQHRMSESLLAMQQTLATLSQETENKLRSVTFLEDSRQRDAKRIAHLQQESLEALKRLEQQGSRLQMLEDVSQRQERDTGELKEVISQLRSSQREFFEKQLMEADQLKRQMAEWGEMMEVYTKKMEGFTARMQEFTESFREDRQVVDNVERFQEMIKREMTQVAELQRLAEERQKRQLEQWQEEDEKRWRKELLRWDHQWGEQAKRNQQMVDTFAKVETQLAHHQADLDAAWKLVSSQVTYQTQESRRWLGEMTRWLEERPKQE
jgi:chromosome segregation ATPase